MPRKKVIKEPIEKLKNEGLVIEEEDSSSEEEEIIMDEPTPTPTPSVETKPKRKSPAKFPCKYCGLEFYKMNLGRHEAKCSKSKTTTTPEPKTEPVAEPVAEPKPKRKYNKRSTKTEKNVDDDDKPLTKKQMMELLNAQKQTAPVDKPKRKYTKRATAPKKQTHTPPPTTPSTPAIMWA